MERKIDGLGGEEGGALNSRGLFLPYISRYSNLYAPIGENEVGRARFSARVEMNELLSRGGH